MTKQLIGTKQACHILDVDKSTLTRWIANNTVVPAHKMDGPNGAYLFDLSDIEALAAAKAKDRTA